MSSAKRRKNYFIKKRFQADFFVKFALLLVLEAALIAALFMHVSKGTLTTAYRGAELTIQSTGSYFFISFILIALVIGLAIGIAGVFIFMFVSHRIGGPLYRFERTVIDAKSGDISQRIKLRKDDQLFELRDLMNSLLEDLDSRIIALKKLSREAMDALEKDKTGNQLNKLKETLRDIKSTLDYYKTSK